MATSPALENILAAKRADPYSDDKTIEQLRANHKAGGTAIPLPDGTTFEAVDAGGVPSEWIQVPNIDEKRVFLFIHGGGYYRGSAAATRSAASGISKASGMRCLSIDYRLAPEDPFPAAINDTYTAYKWLLDQEFEASNIVVGGISAGGGLTCALLLKLKEEMEPLPAGAVPMSAWTDLTQSGKTMQTNAKTDPVISKAYLDRMAGLYLKGADPKMPLASPLFGEFKGLPPMLVQVGTTETMYDDSQRYAEAAQAAGVDVTFEPWDDMFHGWHSSAHILVEAQQASASIGRFCKKVL